MPKAGFIGRLRGRLGPLDREHFPAYLQRLTQEIEFLETVFDTLQEGVMVIDAKRRIRQVNHAATVMLGLPPEVIGRPIAQFLKGVAWGPASPDPAGQERRILRQDLEILYPQARTLTVYVLPQPGERPNRIVVLHDVTEARQRTQVQFESETLRLMSLLAAGVAHEIGNPLNSLHIHLQLLRRRLDAQPRDGDDELREMLEVAKSEADRLHQILAQFLAAIRAVKPSLTPLHLPPLLEETLQGLARELRDREIAVTVQWPEEMPLVYGDAGQLRQAFHNLIHNAIQAMTGGGTLTVSAQSDDDYLTLAVTDTGCGIAPAAIGRIFEPYFTTKSSGSGLGLMIVERIIRENGGQLTVVSEEGRGTTFRVRLPRTSRRIRLLPAPSDIAVEPTPAAPKRRRQRTPRSS